jgi:phosphoribosylaminoimidazole-succinocarboxamide synthase
MESQLISVTSKTAAKQASGGVLLQFPRTCIPGHGSTEERSCAELASEISSYLFSYLHGYKIPTHFVETREGGGMLVRQVKLFPFFIRVWNTAGETLVKRFGVRSGSDLPLPVPELYHQTGRSPAALVNEFHLYAAGVITPGDLRTVNRLASKANAVLRTLFTRRGMRLQALILTFGECDGRIMLCGELTPATCLTGGFSRGRRKGAADEYRLMRDRLLGAAVAAEP